MGFLQFFFIFSLLGLVKASNIYDSTQLLNGVWLSGAAYCGKDNYKTMKVGGPATGFVYHDTLHDSKTDIQGYTGILSSSKTIYVVLRGSSSLMNWLDDFEIRQVSYNSYPECNCKVHNGFYRSSMGITNKTLDSVNILRKKYPSYSVVVTGHSYGAAVGQLLALELEKSGVTVELYNYGQPRVGDDKYADFVNTKIKDLWRTTHNKDIVPHVPPMDVFGYKHSCREIFEDSAGKLTVCSEVDCEDPKCSDQFKLYQTNGDDHTYYLKHAVSCEESVI